MNEQTPKTTTPKTSEKPSAQGVDPILLPSSTQARPPAAGDTPPVASNAANGDEEASLDRRTTIIIAILGIFLLAATIAAVIFMLSNPAATETIRDIMIIFVALEMSIIGIALVILIIQVAQLSALLQNEIKPMLEATNETMNTIRGTSVFLSDHLAQPVMKINSYTSAMRRALDLIRPKPKRK